MKKYKDTEKAIGWERDTGDGWVLFQSDGDIITVDSYLDAELSPENAHDLAAWIIKRLAGEASAS